LLAVVAAANIALGTLCSRNEWIATGGMALIGFAILFSGAVNGYFAAAGTAAMLTFILAAMIPAPASALPDRLEGWALAAVAGICAQLLIWPLPVRAPLGGDAARAAGAIAELAAAELARDAQAVADRVRAAGEAMLALRRRFLGTPHRTSGPMGPQAALASLVDELDWLLSLLAPPAQRPGLDVCPKENAEAVDAVVAALRAAAATLEGRDERPDVERLGETRNAFAQALAGGSRSSRSPPTTTSRSGRPSSRRSGFAPCRSRPSRPPPTRSSQAARRLRSARSHDPFAPRSKRHNARRSSTRARATSGSATACAARRASRSPSTSLSAPASSKDSGSCSERCPSCVRTHSAPAGRS
jgi:hypothetical protein